MMAFCTVNTSVNSISFLSTNQPPNQSVTPQATNWIACEKPNINPRWWDFFLVNLHKSGKSESLWRCSVTVLPVRLGQESDVLLDGDSLAA